jgi:hypothetical protein
MLVKAIKKGGPNDKAINDNAIIEVEDLPPGTDRLPQKEARWPVGLIDTGICEGEGLLAAHLRLTAPENEGLILPMDGYELRENSHQIFLDLKPQNAAEGMLATLAVGVFNSSLSAIAEGSRQRVPLPVRDVNLRHGMKGALVAAQLLQALHRLQHGSEKNVQVGAVNVAAGGQAVVGNVALGKTHKRKKSKTG